MEYDFKHNKNRLTHRDQSVQQSDCRVKLLPEEAGTRLNPLANIEQARRKPTLDLHVLGQQGAYRGRGRRWPPQGGTWFTVALVHGAVGAPIGRHLGGEIPSLRSRIVGCCQRVQWCVHMRAASICFATLSLPKGRRRRQAEPPKLVPLLRCVHSSSRPACIALYISWVATPARKQDSSRTHHWLGCRDSSDRVSWRRRSRL